MINEQVLGELIHTACRNYSALIVTNTVQQVYEMASKRVFNQLRIEQSKVRSKDAQIPAYKCIELISSAILLARMEIEYREKLMDKEYGKIEASQNTIK